MAYECITFYYFQLNEMTYVPQFSLKTVCGTAEKWKKQVETGAKCRLLLLLIMEIEPKFMSLNSPRFQFGCIYIYTNFLRFISKCSSRF